MEKLKRYKNLDYEIPHTSLAWRIYGKRMENFGDNKRPVEIQIPEPGDDEILVRSDAVGLCFSDTKIIKFGSDHPRLQGRDLQKEPVIPGHEVALTVVKVGKNRQKQYRPGERFIIQADIRYKGTKPSYGYVLPGGLSQYGIIGKQALDGDGKSYLIPLKNQNIGYSELALVEPWACVVAAYRISHRHGIKKDGNILITGSGNDTKQWVFNNLFSENLPDTVVLRDIGQQTQDAVMKALSGRNVKIKTEKGPIEKLADTYTGGKGFDDIILLGDSSDDVVESASSCLSASGILNYMASSDKPQVVHIDAGKTHYDVTAIIGSLGTDVHAPYSENPDYTIKGGSVLMIGAGGPMGQMHVQLSIDSKKPPERIIATDIDDKRLNTLRNKFTQHARVKGVEYHVVNPKSHKDPDAYREEVLRLNNGSLFDYVVCLAAIPAVIEDAASYLGEKSVLNIFAGVSKGTIVNLNIKDTVTKAVRYIGSSGSGLDDMEITLRKLESGELDTNNSVAGISGMNYVWKGIDAVRTGSFPGKIVVYPHIRNIDLISLEELREKYPNIGSRLSKNGKWTKDAEEALLEEFGDI